MYLKHSIQKILFTFGLTTVLITGFNMHKDIVHADVLEETTEESTQKRMSTVMETTKSIGKLQQNPRKLLRILTFPITGTITKDLGR